MKHIITVLSIIIILLALSSCSTKNDYDYLPALQIDIPQDLRNNPDAVSFINDNTLMLNKWAKKFENLVVECKPYVTKKDDELTFDEREKLGKTMMELVDGMGKFSVDVTKMQQDASLLKCELSDNEVVSLNQVMEILNQRAKIINKKYFNPGKEL